ncbi:hypothetical protein MLD38_034234 [Melastoma candidum]|uniref:Uncharacterized protein n=1 Tax=Melastoma candidum TaxID=119954 RepID=A0ACB9MAN6_9MYRT|nr:hypothetical protein MLD38_034234 [Melastoma candidum]
MMGGAGELYHRQGTPKGESSVFGVADHGSFIFAGDGLQGDRRTEMGEPPWGKSVRERVDSRYERETEEFYHRREECCCKRLLSVEQRLLGGRLRAEIEKEKERRLWLRPRKKIIKKEERLSSGFASASRLKKKRSLSPSSCINAKIWLCFFRGFGARECRELPCNRFLSGKREAEDNGSVWEPESHAVASPRNGQRSNGCHGTPFSNSAGVSATVSPCKKISKGRGKLNQILRAWSSGLNFDQSLVEIGKELLHGTIDLQKSLRMLVNLQGGSEIIAASRSFLSTSQQDVVGVFSKRSSLLGIWDCF